MPAADRRVGIAVDQDEGAGLAIVGVGVEGDRRWRVDRLQTPTSFSSGSWRRAVASVLTSMLCLSAVTVRRHGARADLQQIGAARQQRLVAHPDQMGGELVGDLRPRGRRRASMSPRAMSTSSASVRVTASPASAASRSPSAVTMRATLVRGRRTAATTISSPARDRAARDRPGKAAEIEMRAG